QRARPLDARGRRRNPPDPAAPARPGAAPLDDGAHPHLRCARVFEEARHAAPPGGSRPAPHHRLRRRDEGAGRQHQLAARAGRERRPILQVNNTYGIFRAISSGLGLGALPDFMAAEMPDLIRVLPEVSGPAVEAYFVYPEELRASKRIAVFRDFLVRKVNEARLVWSPRGPQAAPRRPNALLRPIGCCASAPPTAAPGRCRARAAPCRPARR